MPMPLAASEVLDREFLEVRARVLELAASLDRLERASGSVAEDPRMAKLREALEVVRRQNVADRAEQVQLIFSREYDRQWQQKFGLGNR